MSNKKVSMDAIDSILGGATVSQESTEHTETSTAANKATKRGRPREEEYEARTFRVKRDLVQKLKIIALKEGRLQKDILDYALESTIARYEQKHGAIDVSKEYGKRNLEEIF